MIWTENHFWAALSSVICIIKFIFKLTVTAFKLSSTEFLVSVSVKFMSVLLDFIDDPPLNYGFIVIRSDSVVLGVFEHF